MSEAIAAPSGLQGPLVLMPVPWDSVEVCG
jgi:hypothetical protein